MPDRVAKKVQELKTNPDARKLITFDKKDGGNWVHCCMTIREPVMLMKDDVIGWYCPWCDQRVASPDGDANHPFIFRIWHRGALLLGYAANGE